MIDWLLGTLFATSLLMAMVMVVREPVRQQFGARVAYALWLIPVARLFMPTMTTTVERAVPLIDATPSPFVGSGLAAEPRLMASLAVEPSLIDRLGGWSTLLLMVWLGVAICLFASRLLAFHRERSEILRGAVQLARIGTIRLVRSPAVNGPLAFGIIDRIIAVPVNFDRLYADRERCLALDHELAHHRSGDLIINLFAFVLLCLQWFNPLAWVAHAAFRFDQEAACDARVLDKAKADDRADYGRAIAKAASGRAWLFASALDHRTTLHRRLKSMLNPSSVGRRNAGRVLVVAAIAIALPLTASRAITYVDVPAPAAPAVPAVAPVAAAAPKAPMAPVVPAALLVGAQTPDTPDTPDTVTPGPHDISFIGNDSVRINGRTKSWSELTPGERQRIRTETAKARADLAQSKVDMDRDLANAQAEIEHFRNGDFEKEIAKARADVAEALREIDANAADMRRAGVNPEKIKAEVRASLAEVQNIDVEKIKRETLASLDPQKMKAELRQAEQSLDDIDRKLDDLDRAGRR